MSSKRLLMINPWIHDFAAYDFWLRPMGLLYLAARLRRWGFELDFVDCLDRHNPRFLKTRGHQQPPGKPDGRGKFYKEEIQKPSILMDIPRRYGRYGLPPDVFLEELASLPTPDAILVSSSMTYWYPGVQETIALARRVFPGTTVILGGPYPTLLPDHAEAHSGADHVIKGRDIDRLSHILETLTNRRIPRTGNSIFPSEQDRPAYDLLSSTSSAVIFTSWGCPFRCTYCASWRIVSEYRQREPSRVVEEIDFLCREYQTRHFVFFDDALLFAREKHFEPIVKEIIARNIKATFHTPNALHPRFLDHRVAALMREANFHTIRLSLESASSATQTRTGAKVTNSEFLEAVACLEKAGFPRSQMEVYAMMGLPGQELDEVRRTLYFINAEGCTIRLAVYSPIPGTAEWERAVACSDLPLESDPLLHNPSLFPIRNRKIGWCDFEDLKALAAELNANLSGQRPHSLRDS